MLFQCLVAIFIILLLLDRWKPSKYVKLHKQLGNDWTYLPVLGNILNVIGSNEDLMTLFMQSASQAYKRKHSAISVWLGPKLYVVISGGDQAHTVLKSALDKHFIYKFVKPLLGNGSVFAPVHIWHRRRKLTIGTFIPKHINNFVKVFEKQSNILADYFEPYVERGNIEIFDHMFSYTLITVCETIFGETSNAQMKENRRATEALKLGFKYFANRLVKPWLHIDAIYKMLPDYKKQMECVDFGYRYINNMISAKQQFLAENNENVNGNETLTKDKSKLAFNNFLELMIKNLRENNGNGYTNEELREETMVLIVAGSETIAIAISFTLLMLAQHLNVQDKVYTEIESLFKNPDKPLVATDLMKLKYSIAVIKESLRLYPPVPIITRHCHKDLELPSGLVLPAGCDVVINIMGIQRNPDRWGEDANEFKPERFISGHVSHNDFVAFSQGPRNCIGQQYAMLSIITMLVTILRRYRVKPATNVRRTKHDKLLLTFEIMMKEVNNFAVQFERRGKLETAA